MGMIKTTVIFGTGLIVGAIFADAIKKKAKNIQCSQETAGSVVVITHCPFGTTPVIPNTGILNMECDGQDWHIFQGECV